jgi:hypothetical protein
MSFEPQFRDSVAMIPLKLTVFYMRDWLIFQSNLIKRGIPVKTQFILPVILKVE